MKTLDSALSGTEQSLLRIVQDSDEMILALSRTTLSRKKYVTLPCKFVIQSTIEAVTIAFCRGMEWIDVIVLLPKVGFSF